MIRGTVFDLDGTLFDSMYVWESVDRTFLLSEGRTPEDNLSEKLKAMSLYQAACYLKKEYALAKSTDEIIRAISRRVENAYKNEISLKSGIKNFLENLNKKGIKMCVATASERDLALAALKRCEIADYFSEIFTCSAVGSGKDEPFIFRMAQEHLKTEKGETAVFEDSVHALKTAKADGFITVGVYDDYEKNQEEIRKYSDFYLENFLSFDKFWRLF